MINITKQDPFSKGMLSTFSIFPLDMSLVDQPLQPSFYIDDAAAIHSDWQMVGDDIKQVLEANVKK
jgi:hypothetical protein